MYNEFDPLKEAVGSRYHQAKVLKITDGLEALGIAFAKSWPGARLHALLIASAAPPADSEPPAPPAEEPPPELDDPQVLLGLQSDIARCKAAEPELYRHAYINQLQRQTVRPDVKTSEMTIAECEALLVDVEEQKQLRNTSG